MGCNCGKAGANPDLVRWVYTDQLGNQTEYMTEMFAKRAQINNGGQGTVTQRVLRKA